MTKLEEIDGYEVRKSAEHHIDVPNIGYGTMRTTATQIAIQLQLDNYDRVAILVSAAKAIGITLEEIIGEWNDKACPKCCASLRAHVNGQCP